MNILLVGSKESGTSSKLLLDLITPRFYIDKLYLPGELSQSRKLLLTHMRNKIYNYVFIFAMNDNADEESLQIHLLAKEEGEEYKTNFNYVSLYEYLKEQKMRVALSCDSVSGYTNDLYVTSLRQVYENKESPKSILLNIPVISHIDIMKLSCHITKYFSDSLNVR